MAASSYLQIYRRQTIRIVVRLFLSDSNIRTWAAMNGGPDFAATKSSKLHRVADFVAVGGSLLAECLGSE